VFLLAVAGCARGPGNPSEVVGTWRSEVPPASLEVGPDSFRLDSGHLTKWGTLQRTPFRLAFVLTRTSSPAFRLYCRDVVDVYDWRIEEGLLRFDAVGASCDRAARAVLIAGTWRRVTP
jgi:hypothetical protein